MKTLLFLSVLILTAVQVNAQSYNQVQKVTASDRAAGDTYGTSLAFDGNYAIVGAIHESENSDGEVTTPNAGSAYILKINTDGTWSEVQKIVASDRTMDDNFGSDVALSGDYLVVGAPNDEDAEGENPAEFGGSAYIFEKNTDGTWIEVQKIVASDRDIQDGFGFTVAISGNTVVVGSPYDEGDENNDNALTSAGSAYIFERDDNGNWSEIQKVVPTDREEFDTFGKAVSIENDNILIGAEAESDNDNEIYNAGAAYFYKKDNGGTWNEKQKITPNNRESFTFFGFEISINENFAIFSTPGQSTDQNGENPMISSGGAFIFEMDNNEIWNEVQNIVASDRGEFDAFGKSVSINGDNVVVGAHFNGEDENDENTMNNSGAVYFFERDNNGNWNELNKAVATDRDPSAQFGYSAAIHGESAFIGARIESKDENGENTMSGAGAVYFFNYMDPVGIEEFNFNTSLIAYPNPTYGKTSIDLGKSYDGVVIALHTADGQLIYKRSLGNIEVLELEINGAPGIYFIGIFTIEGISHYLKIIKE
jgi:hypothetical protein